MPPTPHPTVIAGQGSMSRSASGSRRVDAVQPPRRSRLRPPAPALYRTTKTRAPKAAALPRPARHLQFTQKQTAPRYDEAKAHQRQPGSDPRQQRSFSCEINARVFVGNPGCARCHIKIEPVQFYEPKAAHGSKALKYAVKTTSGGSRSPRRFSLAFFVLLT
ncbi:MAG: hypothetical protein JWN34_3417 [Bryobacterales bacterium]|nr:hypothetical protein [Bryobacterales bacterium]